MKTIDFATVANSTTASRPEAQIYLNILYKDTEISLPFGLALDTMPDQNISGSAEWQKQVIARNKFKESLLEFIRNNCKPGETVQLKGVAVQARVKTSKVDTSEEDLTFSFN